MPPWVYVVLLLVTNMFTGASVVVLLRQRHVHDFTDWSEWIQDTVSPLYGDTRATRYRTCEQCSKVEDQQAGEHRCRQVYDRKECPHLEHLIGNEAHRVQRLERELGLG